MERGIKLWAETPDPGVSFLSKALKPIYFTRAILLDAQRISAHPLAELQIGEEHRSRPVATPEFVNGYGNRPRGEFGKNGFL